MNMENNKNKEPEKISSVICRVVWDWIIQITLWISIVLLILIKTSSKEYSPVMNQLSYGFCGLMYLAYIINGIFISRTFKMLLSQKTSPILQSVLETLVKQKPEVSFKVECYHLESNNPNTDIESNSIVDEQKEIRTTTFTESEPFNYYACRDVSGPLALNTDNIKKDQYYYINLLVKPDIMFNDALTIFDYNKQKEMFLNKYRWKDVHMNFIERKYLPGCISSKIYKIQDEVPFCIIWQTYVVFLILGFVELFKLYVKSFVLPFTYTVRKIISTREQLTDYKYECHNPKLMLKDAEIEFDDYHFTNQEYPPKAIADEKEIKSAKQYECLVPSLDHIDNKISEKEYFVSTFRHNSSEFKETIADYYQKIMPDN